MHGESNTQHDVQDGVRNDATELRDDALGEAKMATAIATAELTARNVGHTL
jgi:hypothetical protein